MSRWIDANALAYIVASNGDADFINKVTRLMLDAPSIDICFCKECKHAHADMPTEICPISCEISWGGVFENDFCSYGERKDDE